MVYRAELATAIFFSPKKALTDGVLCTIHDIDVWESTCKPRLGRGD